MKRIQQSVVFGAMWVAIFGMLAVAGTLSSCGVVNQLAGLGRVQFKLNDLGAVRLAGIDIANKHSISDFSVMDGINLVNAFSSGHFPLTFTLNVAARNPNAPSQNSVLNSLQISDFPWRLMLSGHETVSGNVGSPFSVPAGGTSSIIPLQVSVDLKQFFADKGYNDILNLALALSGQGGVSNVQLKAQPTMSTPLGSLRYPSELTIVSTDFKS